VLPAPGRCFFQYTWQSWVVSHSRGAHNKGRASRDKGCSRGAGAAAAAAGDRLQLPTLNTSTSKAAIIMATATATTSRTSNPSSIGWASVSIAGLVVVVEVVADPVG
jgi:hypothetical protein